MWVTPESQQIKILIIFLPGQKYRGLAWDISQTADLHHIKSMAVMSRVRPARLPKEQACQATTQK